jgi:hypothetical protein
VLDHEGKNTGKNLRLHKNIVSDSEAGKLRRRTKPSHKASQSTTQVRDVVIGSKASKNLCRTNRLMEQNNLQLRLGMLPSVPKLAGPYTEPNHLTVQNNLQLRLSLIVVGSEASRRYAEPNLLTGSQHMCPLG